MNLTGIQKTFDSVSFPPLLSHVANVRAYDIIWEMRRILFALRVFRHRHRPAYRAIGSHTSKLATGTNIQTGPFELGTARPVGVVPTRSG